MTPGWIAVTIGVSLAMGVISGALMQENGIFAVLFLKDSALNEIERQRRVAHILVDLHDAVHDMLTAADEERGNRWRSDIFSNLHIKENFASAKVLEIMSHPDLHGRDWLAGHQANVNLLHVTEAKESR
jgi:hypothetical protein